MLEKIYLQCFEMFTFALLHNVITLEARNCDVLCAHECRTEMEFEENLKVIL